MSNSRPISSVLTISLPERSTFLLPAFTVWVGIATYLTSRKPDLGIVLYIGKLESKPVAEVAGLALLGIFTIFVLGHILDLFSHLIFERFLADKLDGYPHERIVPVLQTTKNYNKSSKRKHTNLRLPTFFFEGAKLLIASSVLIGLVSIIERYPNFQNSPKLLLTFKWLLNYGYFSLALSLLFALPAILVRYAPYLTWVKRKQFAKNLLRKVRKARHYNAIYRYVGRATFIFVAVVICPLIFCYDIVDRLVRGFFRLNVEIDQQTFERFQVVIRKRLSLEWMVIQNNDRFWLPYLLLHSENPELLKPIKSIRASSCFCRNQALACILASALFAGAYKLDQVDAPSILTKSDMIHVSLLIFFIGWVFHWRFLQQYYSFTKMTFRAVAIIDQIASLPHASIVDPEFETVD